MLTERKAVAQTKPRMINTSALCCLDSTTEFLGWFGCYLHARKPQRYHILRFGPNGTVRRKSELPICDQDQLHRSAGTLKIYLNQCLLFAE